MKFLHAADLHIGKIVNSYPMLAEQRHAFAQITGYIRTHRPDAVIIAGDVYDRSVPGAEAVRVFDDFLTDLHAEGVAVLIIPGNHDSPERLGFAGRLLSDKGLYIADAARKVTLNDVYGPVNFYLLPFIKILDDSYNEAYSGLLDALNVDYTARNVFVSHQFYIKAGVTPIRSDSVVNPVGGLEYADASLIEGFDYAALGHLHCPQTVGAEHVRYSGSPVKYSFSEWRQKKSVTLVELCEKGRLRIETLPLTPIHDMREIRGTLDELLNLPPSDDYIRAVLTDEEEIIDPMEKLRSVYPNIMTMSFDNARTAIDIADVAAEPAEGLSPYELFDRFFLETQGAVMSAGQERLVKELLEGGEAL